MAWLWAGQPWSFFHSFILDPYIQIVDIYIRRYICESAPLAQIDFIDWLHFDQNRRMCEMIF